MKFIITLYLILLSFNVFAQHYKFKDLKAGDDFSDYVLKDIRNYPNKSIKISELKGKAIILDFWASWCVWCIASFPKMLEIQNRYRKDLQIFMVNQGELSKVGDSFLKQRHHIVGEEFNLPFIYGDIKLSEEMFKHDGIPFLVWIDSKGIIKYFTKPDQVTPDKIQEFINTGTANVITVNEDFGTVKQQFDKFWNIDTTFMRMHSGIKSSVFTGFRRLFPYNDRIHMINDSCVAIMASNNSIIDLYRIAYGQVYGKKTARWINKVPSNRVTVSTTDSKNYGYNYNNDSVQANNLFCYKIQIDKSIEKAQLFMRNDLNQYFNLNAEYKKMKVPCLVLTAEDTSLIVYKNGEQEFKISDTEIHINNLTLTFLISNIENLTTFGLHFLPPFPIIDETQFTGRLGNLHIIARIRDYKMLDKTLYERYKMHLKLENREIDMLLISN